MKIDDAKAGFALHAGAILLAFTVGFGFFDGLRILLTVIIVYALVAFVLRYVFKFLFGDE